MAIETNPLGNTIRFAASRKKRPLVKVERDPELLSAVIPTLLGGYDRYRLTPDRLAGIVADADGGDPREQAALFSTIQEKEPVIAAHLQTRRLAVLSCPWEVRSESDPDTAKAMTRELRRAGLTRAMAHLLDAVGTGYAGVTVDWLPGGKGVAGFVPIMPDVWTFDEGGFPAITPYIGAKEIPLSSFHPAQILYVSGEAKVGLPCRKGLMRTLLWLYLFKNASFRDWGTFLERFGMPFILGKIPAGDFNQKDKREILKRSLLEIRSGGVGVGTTETDMQLLNGGSGSNQTAYELYQRYCDEIVTLSILGQLASSDKAGGLSKGTAQEQVRQDILAADCTLVSDVVNARLVPAMASLEYGRDPDAFEFVIDWQTPEDLAASADRDAKIAAATGCRLSREYAMRKYGVELEEPLDFPEDSAQFGNASADAADGEGKNAQKSPEGAGNDEHKDAQKNAQKSPALDENARFGASSSGQSFADTGARRPDAVDRLVRAAIGRMVDADAFAAWRTPIDTAIRNAFGDLDPDSETLLDDFRAKAPAFLEALPGLMDSFTADEFVGAMRGSLTAAFLNGILPADFWRKRRAPK